MRNRKRNFVKGLAGLVCLGFIVAGWVSNPKLVVVSSLIVNGIPFDSPFASVRIDDRLLTVELNSDCNTYIYEEDLERVELVLNKVVKNRFVCEKVDDVKVVILNKNDTEVYEKVFPNDDIEINLIWNEKEAIKDFNKNYAPPTSPANSREK